MVLSGGLESPLSYFFRATPVFHKLYVNNHIASPLHYYYYYYHYYYYFYVSRDLNRRGYGSGCEEGGKKKLSPPTRSIDHVIIFFLKSIFEFMISPKQVSSLILLFLKTFHYNIRNNFINISCLSFHVF